jgi:hypothetical protein
MAKGKKKLTAFEGEDVLGTTIKITNAGDGLSKAMSIDNEELHRKQIVHVILECEVTKVTFQELKDADGAMRVHVLKAGRATMIDGKLVEEALDEQDKKLEEAAGIQRLPLDEEPSQN